MLGPASSLYSVMIKLQRVAIFVMNNGGRTHKLQPQYFVSLPQFEHDCARD